MTANLSPFPKQLRSSLVSSLEDELRLIHLSFKVELLVASLFLFLRQTLAVLPFAESVMSICCPYVTYEMSPPLCLIRLLSLSEHNFFPFHFSWLRMCSSSSSPNILYVMVSFALCLPAIITNQWTLKYVMSDTPYSHCSTQTAK